MPAPPPAHLHQPKHRQHGHNLPRLSIVLALERDLPQFIPALVPVTCKHGNRLARGQVDALEVLETHGIDAVAFSRGLVAVNPLPCERFPLGRARVGVHEVDGPFVFGVAHVFGAHLLPNHVLLVLGLAGPESDLEVFAVQVAPADHADHRVGLLGASAQRHVGFAGCEERVVDVVQRAAG